MLTDPDLLTADILPAQMLGAADIAAWRAIAASNPALNSPFFAPEFTLSVAKAREGIMVAAIRDRGLPFAYLPFQFAGAWQRRARAAESVGGPLSAYCGVIAPDQVRISPGDLLGLAELNSFAFSGLIASQAEDLDSERSAHGFLAGLRGGWRAYWTVRCAADRAFAADIEHSARKLMDACGLLRFTFDDRDPKALQHLAAAACGRHGAPVWTRALVESLAATRAIHCTGLVSTLFAGETWVASRFGLCSPRTLHCWFSAHNPELAGHMPDRLMLRAILEAAAARRITAVDFGVSDAPYLSKFATAGYPVYRGHWYRPGIAAFGYRVAHSLAGRFKAAAAPL